MRLEKATNLLMNIAVKLFHYSRTRPKCVVGYSVYNDLDLWCGCILYGAGANMNIGKELGLTGKKLIFLLVRVALNGKQGRYTSRSVAMSIRQIRKDIPTLQALVSYADTNQNHLGILYQATNWIYVGLSAGDANIVINGIPLHRRTVYTTYGSSSIKYIRLNIDHNATVIKLNPKHKYYFLFNKKLRKVILDKIKPYPKTLN